MTSVSTATDQTTWDSFLISQRFSPFLQSWTMGEVYREIGQEPVHLEVRDGDRVTGICLAHVVPARRGRHLAVPYGPVLERVEDLPAIIDALKDAASDHQCSFIRFSPFFPDTQALCPPSSVLCPLSSVFIPSPLHLLAEHIWYLPLKNPDPWNLETRTSKLETQTEAELLSAMRKTTRNLIRRAEKDGVTIERSKDPVADLPQFIALHDETRKRHKFTPHSNAFFRAQVKHFAPQGEAILYLARFQGQIIAASIHMAFGGETSYHHGASASAFAKIPASCLLQWTAIRDALARGDGIYNFWGIAPGELQATSYKLQARRHPFAGVTLFKTGFGGQLLTLQHCMDIPLKNTYYLTRWFEYVRKWKRGF